MLTALALLPLAGASLPAAEPATDGTGPGRCRRPAQAGRNPDADRSSRQLSRLKGSDDAQQLIVTATLTGGRLQDLTGDVKYEVADAKVVRVTTTGRVMPAGQRRHRDHRHLRRQGGQGRRSRAESCDVNLPINFANQIVPIFTKLGCNSGGCHGKAERPERLQAVAARLRAGARLHCPGQGSRGRRLFPAAPEHSLLLLKAAGQMAHGGGKRMEPDSDEYQLIRRWIAAGMPFGKPTIRWSTKITVYPEHRILTRQNKQQFAVYAHYSDGSRRGHHPPRPVREQRQEIAVVERPAWCARWP